MIQYERVVYEETNTLSSLNITRGVFTADTPGVWKVDWSLVTEPEDGEAGRESNSHFTSSVFDNVKNEKIAPCDDRRTTYSCTAMMRR